MKIVQSNAISVNGMIAREDGDEDWLPSEGWDEFVADVTKYGNFIMGRETYELVKKLYPDYNFDNVKADFKLIVTARHDYIQPDGYIVTHSPEEAVDFLKAKNAQVGLLIGGGNLNSSFYSKQLVDETWLTISPTILGNGRSFVAAREFEVELKLLEVIQLNKERIQIRYEVVK